MRERDADQLLAAVHCLAPGCLRRPTMEGGFHAWNAHAMILMLVTSMVLLTQQQDCGSASPLVGNSGALSELQHAVSTGCRAHIQQTVQRVHGHTLVNTAQVLSRNVQHSRAQHTPCRTAAFTTLLCWSACYMAYSMPYGGWEALCSCSAESHANVSCKPQVAGTVTVLSDCAFRVDGFR